MRQGTVLILPLVSSGEPHGVFVVQAVTEAGLPEERRTVLADVSKLLADTVGASLREESAALRMTKIAAINEAGVNIISTLDLSRLLKLVATSSCLILEAETCIIRLLDPQTGKFGIRESYGMKTESEQKDLFLMDKKAVTRILKGEPSLLVRDVSAEPEWQDFGDVARTLICLPLRSDEGILGTVSIFDKFPHKTFFPSSFTTEDLSTFGKFVRYVEKAVANAIAYERNDRLRNLDESTRLPTLKYFQDRLLHEISRAKRFQRRLVLMICEVYARVPEDAQPRIGRGDWVMKRVAKAIRESLREYDVVARISEAKFGMILPEAEDGKLSAIPRIKKAIAAEVEEIRKKNKDARIDVRFGHATFPEDGDDHEKLIFKSNILKM
jgi:diguanylate cyclase (GGDEF)-like protein